MVTPFFTTSVPRNVYCPSGKNSVPPPALYSRSIACCAAAVQSAPDAISFAEMKSVIRHPITTVSSVAYFVGASRHEIAPGAVCTDESALDTPAAATPIH